MHGILRGTATVSAWRIRVADVFGRESHEPPRDIQRILSGFHHPGEPVHRRIRMLLRIDLCSAESGCSGSSPDLSYSSARR